MLEEIEVFLPVRAHVHNIVGVSTYLLLIVSKSGFDVADVFKIYIVHIYMLHSSGWSERIMAACTLANSIGDSQG